MRVKYLVIGYTVCMALVLGAVLHPFHRTDIPVRDMAAYNGQFKQVERELRLLEGDFEDTQEARRGTTAEQSDKESAKESREQSDDESEKKSQEQSDDESEKKLREQSEEESAEEQRERSDEETEEAPQELTDEARKSLEDRYACELLFLTDEDYEARLFSLIQEGAAIFDYYDADKIVGKIAFRRDEEKLYYERLRGQLRGGSIAAWLILLASGYVLLGVVWYYFARPFDKLQKFSAQIAKGNLDLPLPAGKRQFFGAFTESFDIMREELRRARESEYQANRSKKELIAQLSHDIKTPVASIKATSEVMQLKETNQEKLDKIQIITNKADTIDRLISNLFHASLEELEMLKVEAVEESSLVIKQIIEEQKLYGDLTFNGEIPECLVLLDQLRFEQVIGNIVGNSYKYANTPITIDFSTEEQGIRIRIRDEGPGIPEKELALLTEKFYRGSNAKGKDGSGLGLYLARLFMRQMEGDLTCFQEQGFVVELFVRKAVKNQLRNGQGLG